MRPQRSNKDRLSSLTTISDIISIHQSARQSFNNSFQIIKNTVENRGQNLSSEEISRLIPNDLVSKSNSLISHIVHNQHHNRPDITGIQRMTIYFSDKPITDLASSHHCDLRTIYRIQSDPLSAFGLTFRQFKVFLCDLLDDCSKSFYSTVSRVPIILPSLPNNFRPGKKSSIHPIYQSIIRAILVHKSELYLDQILSFLVFLNPRFVSSISSLSRSLRRMGFSTKVPNRVICHSDYSESILFRNLFLSKPFYTFQLVFLDESSNSRKLGIHQRARAPRGITPIARSRNTGKRYTCVGAISIQGLFYFELLPGALNTATFQRILFQNVLPLMNPYPEDHSVLILDNCRSHILSPNQIFKDFGVIVLFLPPYSPFLNPIERLFSAMKAKIKRLVYDNSSLRNNPVSLWTEALKFCSIHFDFQKVIESTYVPDDHTEQINLRI